MSSIAREILLKRLRTILRRWPEDATKKGRDLGEFFAKSYTARFQKEDIPNVSTVQVHRPLPDFYAGIKYLFLLSTFCGFFLIRFMHGKLIFCIFLMGCLSQLDNPSVFFVWLSAAT